MQPIGASGKLLLFHDYFAIRGGGERLVLTLAEALGGDLVYGYRTSDTYERAMFPSGTLDLRLPLLLRRSGVRPLALACLFARQRRAAEKAQIRIFSGVAAPFAAPPRSSAASNIYYCHTPPRFLFDQRAHFVAQLTRSQKMAALPLLDWFEGAYRRAIARMDIIVANSENTRRRIMHFLGRDSVVVYPPVDTDRFVWLGQGDYYLSTARLTPLKRVGAIIEAFRTMPEKKLLVASGGEDLDHLVARAAGAANIQFTGWIDDEQLRGLVGTAIATLYVPRDEDFGMSPIESMSAGKPVIGVAEGGLLETILDGETGYLVSTDFNPSILAAAVRLTTSEEGAKHEKRVRSKSAAIFAGSFRQRDAGNRYRCRT